MKHIVVDMDIDINVEVDADVDVDMDIDIQPSWSRKGLWPMHYIVIKMGYGIWPHCMAPTLWFIRPLRLRNTAILE